MTELNSRLNFLAANPRYAHTTMTRAEVRAMLIAQGDTMLACGRLYNIVAKHVGAGVYRVSLRERDQ